MGEHMKYSESIVGITMKAINPARKALKAMLATIILSLACLGLLSISIAQETSTLTPVQTESTLQPQDSPEEVINLTPDGTSVVVTTVVTTPAVETKIVDSNPESQVCNALAVQIVDNLANYPDWQISLNDANGNVQGLGEMGSDGLELQLFNPNAKELYLFYFTDEKAITIANSSGLRISLFEKDNGVATSSTGTDSRGIIINATIGENREASPINECILPFEQVFPNYVIK